VYNLLADQAEPEDPGGVNVSQPSDAQVAQAAFNTLFLGLRVVAWSVPSASPTSWSSPSSNDARRSGCPQAPGATRAHIRIQFLETTGTNREQRVKRRAVLPR
jgi:hypothetical protein